MLSRKTPLRAKTRMKSGSTLKRSRMKAKRRKPMTKAERDYVLLVKGHGCLCCRENPRHGLMTAKYGPAEAHHLKDGDERRGHRFVIGLCAWHHRGEPPRVGMSKSEAAKIYGPSLAEDARAFHFDYGSDAVLLEKQSLWIAACSSNRRSP